MMTSWPWTQARPARRTPDHDPDPARRQRCSPLRRYTGHIGRRDAAQPVGTARDRHQSGRLPHLDHPTTGGTHEERRPGIPLGSKRSRRDHGHRPRHRPARRRPARRRHLGDRIVVSRRSTPFRGRPNPHPADRHHRAGVVRRMTESPMARTSHSVAIVVATPRYTMLRAIQQPKLIVHGAKDIVVDAVNAPTQAHSLKLRGATVRRRSNRCG